MTDLVPPAAAALGEHAEHAPASGELAPASGEHAPASGELGPELALPRTAFLHGRPEPHPFHAALLRAVGADFAPIDPVLRWHGIAASRPRRYLSWLLSALWARQRGRYELIVSEGLHFPPVLMRRLGRLRPGQRVATLLANETLYFLRDGRYGTGTAAALRWALRGYDALLCIGSMQAQLAREALASPPSSSPPPSSASPSSSPPPPPPSSPLLLTLPSAVEPARAAALSQGAPDLDGRRLVFIGSGTVPWRAYYKGMDLLLAAFAQARQAPGAGDLTLDIVGQWTPASLIGLALPLPGVRLVGPQPDIGPALRAAALYVHLGRGEAFGISVLEAMLAGVPALVSEWTGAREAVERVDPRLVVPLDAAAAAARIGWYLQLPRSERASLSLRSRAVAAGYTYEQARLSMRDAARQVMLAAP